MIDVVCRCGNGASLKTQNGMYEIKCESCKRVVGPSPSFDEVYRKWYLLVPMKRASQDICESMKIAIMEVSRQWRVDSKCIINKCPNDDAGRRALNILLDSGIISATYVHDGKEDVSFEDAMKAKKAGEFVAVYFSKNFSSSKLE